VDAAGPLARATRTTTAMGAGDKRVLSRDADADEHERILCPTVRASAAGLTPTVPPY